MISWATQQKRAKDILLAMKSPDLLPLLAFAALLPCASLDAARYSAGKFGPDGSYYEAIYYTDRSFAWEEARTQVSLEGGESLASIQSEAVDLFVEGLRQEVLQAAGIDPFASTAPSLWIGGKQDASATRPKNGWAWDLELVKGAHDAEAESG